MNGEILLSVVEFDSLGGMQLDSEGKIDVTGKLRLEGRRYGILALHLGTMDRDSPAVG